MKTNQTCRYHHVENTFWSPETDATKIIPYLFLDTYKEPSWRIARQLIDPFFRTIDIMWSNERKNFNIITITSQIMIRRTRFYVRCNLRRICIGVSVGLVEIKLPSSLSNADYSIRKVINANPDYQLWLCPDNIYKTKYGTQTSSCFTQAVNVYIVYWC